MKDFQTVVGNYTNLYLTKILDSNIGHTSLQLQLYPHFLAPCQPCYLYSFRCCWPNQCSSISLFLLKSLWYNTGGFASPTTPFDHVVSSPNQWTISLQEWWAPTFIIELVSSFPPFLGRRQTGVTPDTRTKKWLLTQLQLRRHPLLAEGNVLMSPAAKVYAGCTPPGHTIKESIQFTCKALYAVWSILAAQHRSQDFTVGAEWSMNTTWCHALEDGDTLVLTCCWWWDSRRGAASRHSLPTCCQAGSKQM